MTRSAVDSLAGGAGYIRALISKQYRGDKYPSYSSAQTLSLSADNILNIYQQRWPVEVDNFYLKQPLRVGNYYKAPKPPNKGSQRWFWCSIAWSTDTLRLT